MLRPRVIPCLLLNGPRLVKTKKFDAQKYIGDPVNAIRIFNEKCADEIVLLDISASKKKTRPQFELIEEIAGECFVPLCYGGGIRDLEDAKQLFSLGIEKICIQSAYLQDMNLIQKLSERYGAQSIVASVDIRKNIFGKKSVYHAAAGNDLKISWQDLIRQLVKAGAGEIFLNSVNKDGMRSGLDIDVISEAAKMIDIPLIACGGVGSLADIQKGIQAGASAVAVGSYFVLHGAHDAVLISYLTDDEMNLMIESN